MYFTQFSINPYGPGICCWKWNIPGERVNIVAAADMGLLLTWINLNPGMDQ